MVKSKRQDLEERQVINDLQHYFFSLARSLQFAHLLGIDVNFEIMYRDQTHLTEVTAFRFEIDLDQEHFGTNFTLPMRLYAETSRNPKRKFSLMKQKKAS